jgi:two-component system, cell cycle response regulator CpdR
VPAPKNILIVDDNALTLLTLTRILQQHGYSALGASDAASALRLVQAQAVDLVIMDYNLPDSRGEFGPALKRMRPGLPVVVLSGDPGAAEASTFADLLLPKPQEPEALLGEIGRVLQQAAQRKAA